MLFAPLFACSGQILKMGTTIATRYELADIVKDLGLAAFKLDSAYFEKFRTAKMLARQAAETRVNKKDQVTDAQTLRSMF